MVSFQSSAADDGRHSVFFPRSIDLRDQRPLAVEDIVNIDYLESLECHHGVKSRVDPPVLVVEGKAGDVKQH